MNIWKAVPRVCLHQEQFPVRNPVEPARLAVASCSCSSRSPVWICVIVTGSITTLKCDNIICNNKNKLAWCHLCTTCSSSPVSRQRAMQTTHTHTYRGIQPKAHVSTSPLQFVSLTQAGSDFRPCGLLNIYRNTHQTVCHYCLQESDLWRFLRRRKKADMVWMSFREKRGGGEATVASWQSLENSLIRGIYTREKLRELPVLHVNCDIQEPFMN